MAIPFYEDEPDATAAAAASFESSQIADGDQVDGPGHASDTGYDQVDFEAPSGATSNSQATSTATVPPVPPSTEEQLLAWKLLALAMCKVLKQFYLQQKKQQQTGSSTKLTATVQIQPQAQ